MLGNQQTTCESVGPDLVKIRRHAGMTYAPRSFGIEQEVGKAVCVSEAAVFETEVLVDHHNNKPVIPVARSKSR